VFDGRQRYDVTLSYDRMETVAPNKEMAASVGVSTSGTGYSGPVIVCKARYKAVAGHRPMAENVQQLESSRDLEVWLAPMTGARVLVPWKIVAGTPNGRITIEAMHLAMDGSKSTLQRADVQEDEALQRTEVAARRTAQ
jgi:hypothetical protein